jgi:streptogramin lyase
MSISKPFMRPLLLLLSGFSLLAVVLFVSLPADAVTIKEFTIPTTNSTPRYITAGPDGNLWFTEMDGNKIGRITTAGVDTEFTVLGSTSGPGSTPSICSGSDKGGIGL